MTTARKKHSVSWLERELAEAREDLQIAGERIDATNIALTKKNDMLVQALNERDEARNERDEYYRALRLANAECTELRKDLRRIQEAHEDLIKRNRANFDKASRIGDVAAMMACIVAKTYTLPDAMVELSGVAVQMGISPNVLNEIQTALKRGYAAQVEMVAGELVEQIEEVGPGLGAFNSNDF